MTTPGMPALRAATEYEVTVPKPSGDPLKLKALAGRSIIIVGANGSGKTRLGVHIEAKIPANAVQRIAAHKSLAMRDDLNLVSLERATNLLRFGYAEGTEVYKQGHRWGSKPATHLLTDFDALLQTLFAKHNRVSSSTGVTVVRVGFRRPALIHQRRRARVRNTKRRHRGWDRYEFKPNLLDFVCRVWTVVLLHRGQQQVAPN
jgi:energy-coupling factor transporter ATP-binding protein EcfA2